MKYPVNPIDRINVNELIKSSNILNTKFKLYTTYNQDSMQSNAKVVICEFGVPISLDCIL